MAGQPGFFDLSDRYEALSAAGDPLERLASVVDFEVFRGPLIAALRRSVRGKGGRPPFDPVMMFKILVLQALYSLSDEATEFQIKDRLSFQRFLGLGLDGTVPDATTVWLFRERLVQAKAIDTLFARFDAALTDRGYLVVREQCDVRFGRRCPGMIRRLIGSQELTWLRQRPFHGVPWEAKP